MGEYDGLKQRLRTNLTPKLKQIGRCPNFLFKSITFLVTFCVELYSHMNTQHADKKKVTWTWSSKQLVISSLLLLLDSISFSDPDQKCTMNWNTCLGYDSSGWIELGNTDLDLLNRAWKDTPIPLCWDEKLSTTCLVRTYSFFKIDASHPTKALSSCRPWPTYKDNFCDVDGHPSI